MDIKKKLRELNYVNYFKLKYFNNTIINNFIPVHLINDYNEKKNYFSKEQFLINWYDKEIKKYDKNKNKLRVLPNNKVYLVLVNTYSPDLGPNNTELLHFNL